MKKKYTDKQLLDALESRVSEDRPWQYWVSVYWAPTLRESLALIKEDHRGYQKNRTKKELDEVQCKVVTELLPISWKECKSSHSVSTKRKRNAPSNRSGSRSSGTEVLHNRRRNASSTDKVSHSRGARHSSSGRRSK